MDDKLMKVCGLWERDTKSGAKMLSGTLGSLRVVILPNQFKKSEKEPTWTLFITQAAQKNEASEKKLNTDIPF